MYIRDCPLCDMRFLFNKCYIISKPCAINNSLLAAVNFYTRSSLFNITFRFPSPWAKKVIAIGRACKTFAKTQRSGVWYIYLLFRIGGEKAPRKRIGSGSSVRGTLGGFSATAKWFALGPKVKGAYAPVEKMKVIRDHKGIE